MSNDLLARLQAAKTDDEREWVVMEFSLQNLEQEIQDAIWAAAIPHWFDVNFLAALLEKPVKQVEIVYKRMQELSFVEVFPGRGYNIHERTRKLLLKHLWEEDTDKFREISRRAERYSAARDQNDVAWRVELVYHELIADPEQGATKLQEIGWSWNNTFAYNKVDVMVRVVREHTEAGRLDGRALGWAQFWDALVDLDFFRYQNSSGKLLGIDLEKSKDKHLAAEVKNRLGDVYSALSEYTKARESYAISLDICKEIQYRQGEANCLKSLGNVLRMQSEFKEARARFEEAAPIFREIGDKLGEANCTESLGDVYYVLSQPDSARERYEEALAIFQQIGAKVGEANCIKGLGDVHRMKSEFAEARTRYEEAATKSKEIGDRLGEANCLQMIGFVDKLLADNDSARKNQFAALTIYEEIGNKLGVASCYLYLGDSDKYEKKWKDAESKYQKALIYYQQEGMGNELALAYWRLGDTAKDKGDLDVARRYYNDAIDIFIKIGSPNADIVRESLNSLSK